MGRKKLAEAKMTDEEKSELLKRKKLQAQIRKMSETIRRTMSEGGVAGGAGDDADDKADPILASKLKSALGKSMKEFERVSGAKVLKDDAKVPAADSSAAASVPAEKPAAVSSSKAKAGSAGKAGAGAVAEGKKRSGKGKGKS